MADFALCHDFLARMGANERGHAGASLLDHLVGTYRLAQRFGFRMAVQNACLFHRIYGTSLSEQSMLVPNEENRALVREMIGTEAEHLVYLFCAMDGRDVLWEVSSRTYDRFTGDTLYYREYLRDLREIEYCNLIDQEGLGGAIEAKLEQLLAETRHG